MKNSELKCILKIPQKITFKTRAGTKSKASVSRLLAAKTALSTQRAHS